ncbi:cytochrome b-c1 complex subunit 8 [Vararia minispora EC-137]|uniref:Cytochrome b-c1 complex subunit 8 n=1 Tax=Vararia minispora EC-137 TaxID=1314806 RepID=A0ACB8QZ15_9AGAM|nr:cytochrome b-c1 complex subunit 8 [Vararia minispora EC-137]
MPGPKVYNVWWGDYAHGTKLQKGIVQYTVSPFYANPTKNMFRDWLFNGTRRLGQQLPYWSIPFAIGYAVYTWGNKRYAWQNSKEGHIASGEHHD